MINKILEIIQRAAAQEDHLLVTLDGPCATGKTTLAGELAKALNAAVIHTDDFVIPHAQKTPERLAIPGGNCDVDRLYGEVVMPWKQDRKPIFQRYDFIHDCLLPPETFTAEHILIIEGSYCNLPLLRDSADVRLFMTAPFDARLERLRRRESPASLQGFLDRWIPLEDAYFAAYGLPDAGCILVHT